MRIGDWQPMLRATLRGFLSVEVMGLRIRDCHVHFSHGKAWVGLPSKVQVDRDGVAKRDAGGKLLYVPVVEFRTKELFSRFRAAVVELLLAEHPETAVTAADRPRCASEDEFCRLYGIENHAEAWKLLASRCPPLCLVWDWLGGFYGFSFFEFSLDEIEPGSLTGCLLRCHEGQA
jgi:hypothetical protein